MKRGRLSLSRDERTIILQACKRYRNSLPLYLQSVREELEIIKAILKKLS